MKWFDASPRRATPKGHNLHHLHSTASGNALQTPPFALVAHYRTSVRYSRGMQILPSTSMPWPVSATAPRCAASVHSGMTTGPGPCHYPVTSFVLIRYPTSPAAIWPTFLCSAHAREVGSLAEPLDRVAAAELADRREQHALAMTGQPYRRPVPLQLSPAAGATRPGGSR